MQFIYQTLNEISPVEEEKQRLTDQVKLYESLFFQLIQKADIVQYIAIENEYRIYVSKYNSFFIAIPHAFECQNLWNIAKDEYDCRAIKEESKND